MDTHVSGVAQRASSSRGLWRTLAHGFAAAQSFSHRELTEGAQRDRKKRGEIGRQVFMAWFQ
jgi:hypothetical protein